MNEIVFKVDCQILANSYCLRHSVKLGTAVG